MRDTDNVIILGPRKRENKMEFDEHVDCVCPGKSKYPEENGGVDTEIRGRDAGLGLET